MMPLLLLATLVTVPQQVLIATPRGQVSVPVVNDHGVAALAGVLLAQPLGVSLSLDGSTLRVMLNEQSFEFDLTSTAKLLSRFLERDITVTRGLLNSSLVHPREVFREAIAERAAAIILVHNHPSGDPTPSPDDRVVTEQLVQAGKVLDIPVQDHVIIGRGRYISFAEAGLL